MLLDLPPPSHFEQVLPVRAETIWQELLEKHQIECDGADAELRPVFVGLQAHFEAWLAEALRSGHLRDVQCYITTPAPSSPFCVAEEELSQISTVTARAATLEALLDLGVDVTLIYDVNGLEQRSPAQARAFLENLERHPEHLHRVEADFSALDPSLRDMLIPGATYLCRGPDEELLVFSLVAPQAHAPDDAFLWRAWLGFPADDPAISGRVMALALLFKEIQE